MSLTSGVSLLKPLGYQKNKSCGYCKGTSGTCSYYLSCDGMKVDHYLELMDRGWRRSGTTYYKPDLARSCCPAYSIRLEAKHFKSKTEQRRAVNRWNDFVLGSEYKRKLAMLCPQSREEKRQKRDKFDLVEAVHKAEYQNLKRPMGKRSQVPIEPAHKFEVSLESDAFTKEKHAVFLRYQIEIHKDPEWRWREDSFTRFLCKGLDRKVLKVNGTTLKLGSYHECYRLDGKLIAVAVLDLLPKAVSSVYFFYDPEFQQWDLGKLSAMREIALATDKKYEWYYMGHYIHSCVKIRYKGTFEPSYLLDPESLEWNILDDEFRKKLDQRKYVSLSGDRKSAGLIVDTSASTEGPNPTSEAHDVHEEASATAQRSTQPVDTNSTEYELDSEPSDTDDTEIPEGSLFKYNIPGVMKMEEVEKLELGNWKLFVRNMLVDFEDIRGWEDDRMDDPTSIRGIVSELAATIGPNMIANTAVLLF